MTAGPRDFSRGSIVAIGVGAWRQLLEFFDADDTTVAAARYEEVRQQLFRFFRGKGCPNADELADKTLNRVASKLEGGEDIRTEHPERYVMGVAKLFYFERVRREMRQRRAEREEASLPEETLERKSAEERQARALEECMAELSPEERAMLVRYYRGSGRERIEARGTLAEELEMSPNALRIRVHRIRQDLERRVVERVARDAGDA